MEIGKKMFGLNIFKRVLKLTDGKDVYKKLLLDQAVVDDDNNILNPGALGQRFQEFVSTNNIEPDSEIWVGLDDQKVHVRSVQSVSGRDDEDVVREDIQKLGFDSKEVYFTYRQVAGDKIQFVFVEKDYIDNYKKAVADAGLDTKGFVPVSFALASLTASLDLPHLLVISENENLLFVLVDAGGFAVTNALFKLDSSAEDYKSKVVSVTSEFLESVKDKVPVRDIRKIYVGGVNRAEIAKSLASSGLLTEELEVAEPAFIKAFAVSQYKDKGLTLCMKEEKKKKKIKKKLSKSVVEKKNQKEKDFKLSSIIKKDAWIVGVGAIAVVAILGILGYLLFAGGKADDEIYVSEKEPVVSPRPPLEQQSSPSSYLPTGVEEQATPSGSPQATPSAGAQLLIKADYKIQVLNGWGVQGVASEAEQYLESKGWVVEDTRNTYWKRGVTVKTKEGAERLREELIADLSAKYEYMDEPEVLESESEYDAVVIIGSQSE